MSDSEEAAADRVGRLARDAGLTVGVAESLTCGRVSLQLGAAEEASTWYAGGITAYLTSTKRAALNVTADLAVSALAAEQMATGCRTLLGCDIAIAVTGAGGPEPQDNRPAGTVYVAVDDGSVPRVIERNFSGDAESVVEQSSLYVLEQLGDAIESRTEGAAGRTRA